MKQYYPFQVYGTFSQTLMLELPDAFKPWLNSAEVRTGTEAMLSQFITVLPLYASGRKATKPVEKNAAASGGSRVWHKTKKGNTKTREGSIITINKVYHEDY